MTDAEYIYHQTNRERKRNGYGDRCKKRRGGKNVRLPSDKLTKKELERMNGKIVTFRLDKPMNYEEFKMMPMDIRKEYLELLREKHFGTGVEIARMLGISHQRVSQIISELGVKQHKKGKNTKEEDDIWRAFLNNWESQGTNEMMQMQDITTEVISTKEEIHEEKMPTRMEETGGVLMMTESWNTLNYLRGRIEGIACGIENKTMQEGLLGVAEMLGEVLNKERERVHPNEL